MEELSPSDSVDGERNIEVPSSSRPNLSPRGFSRSSIRLHAIGKHNLCKSTSMAAGNKSQLCCTSNARILCIRRNQETKGTSVQDETEKASCDRNRFVCTVLCKRSTPRTHDITIVFLTQSSMERTSWTFGQKGIPLEGKQE